MRFVKTTKMNIKVSKEQECQLSSKEKINKVIFDTDVLAFDIYDNESLIGFAMLKQFDKNKFFLWDYAIDFKYQNQGLGFKALKELIKFLKFEYNCNLITTTYKMGNDIACGLYRKVGFEETDMVDDGDIKEVNMQLKC